MSPDPDVATGTTGAVAALRRHRGARRSGAAGSAENDRLCQGSRVLPPQVAGSLHAWLLTPLPAYADLSERAGTSSRAGTSAARSCSRLDGRPGKKRWGASLTTEDYPPTLPASSSSAAGSLSLAGFSALGSSSSFLSKPCEIEGFVCVGLRDRVA